MGSQNATKRECGRRARPGASRQRSGTVLLFLVFALVALLGLAALATDVGHVWAVRTELQGAVDAAALAAARDIVDPTNTSVTLPAARNAAEAYALLNEADQNQVIVDGNADLTFGNWDLATATFDTTVNLANPDEVTAVRVEGRMDGVRNPTMKTVLARVLGRSEFAVGATAIGYLGWAGSFVPGSIDLPIAIDCCAITEATSCTNACDYLAQNPYPNPTLLADGVTLVTKLEFDSTVEQNACWTEFGQESQISTPDLEGVIDAGNTDAFGVYDEGIQLDNGDKTPVVRLIRDKMMGWGDYENNPSGSDLYDPPDGIDSWVVGLPVIECQGEDHCAGPNNVAVVGAVCFEIREVRVTPEKELLGRFFCPGPTEPLSCDIGGAGSGGENFGIRASRSVLVQ